MARTGDNMALREIKALNPAQTALLGQTFNGSFLEDMRKLRELRERSYKDHELREQKKKEQALLDAQKSSTTKESTEDSNIDLNEVSEAKN